MGVTGSAPESDLTEGALKKNIFLAGSCIIRDVFSYDAENRLSIVDYYSSSSLSSSTSPLPVVDPRVRNLIQNLDSDFRRKVVDSDLDKQLFKNLLSFSCDYLLIDFIDERFGVFVFNDGRVMTYSHYLSLTGIDLATLPGHLVPPLSEEFFELWEQGWERFVEFCKRNGLLKKVRLCKVLWATATKSGMDYLPSFNLDYILRVNSFLERLYVRAERDLPQEQIFVSPASDLVGADEHRWGKEPYHFVDSYYLNVLAQLYKLP